MRRLLAALVLVAGSIAGAVLFRRHARSRERVDLYFEDGTTLALPGGSPEAAAVLPLARRLLAAAI